MSVVFFNNKHKRRSFINLIEMLDCRVGKVNFPGSALGVFFAEGRHEHPPAMFCHCQCDIGGCEGMSVTASACC